MLEALSQVSWAGQAKADFAWISAQGFYWEAIAVYHRLFLESPPQAPLNQRIHSLDEEERMPPEGEPLTREKKICWIVGSFRVPSGPVRADRVPRKQGTGLFSRSQPRGSSMELPIQWITSLAEPFQKRHHPQPTSGSLTASAPTFHSTDRIASHPRGARGF